MRFSIVFDDNGTVLAASEGGEEIDKPRPGAGVSSFDISDDLPEAELHQTVERLLVDLDASELRQSPARGEADETKST